MGRVVVAFLLLTSALHAQSIPGVKIFRDSDERTLLPPGYDLVLIDVDWTNPRLKTELLAPKAPMRWEDAVKAKEGAVMIQLAEPKSEAQKIGPADARVEVGGIIPWLPCGGSVEGQWSSPLAGSAPSAAVMWMGRADEFDKFPELTFRDRCILSWTDPVSARTTFALIGRTANDEVKTADLKPWLKTHAHAGRWLALHSTGLQAIAGHGPELQGPTPMPRFIGRVGTALVLSGLDEPIDLARLPGAKISASSADAVFPPQNVISGRLLPSPLQPTAWQNRPQSEQEGASAWIRVELAAPAEIREIRLFWPMVAGWSSHFNPARARLEVAAPDDEFKPVLEIVKPTLPVTSWKPAKPVTIRAARVIFAEPSQMPLDQRARLCGFSVLK